MDRLYTPWRYAYITGAQPHDHRKGVPPELSAWPQAEDRHCVFCNMLAAADWAISQGKPAVEAERAIWLLERHRFCFTVLNAFPYSNGHLMVVPYEHAASLAGLPLATAQEMLREVRRAELALRAVYRPDGLNVGLNMGEAAGAGVTDHLHIHALPRWAGDGNFMTVIGETRVLPEMLGESWQRLRSSLVATPKEG